MGYKTSTSIENALQGLASSYPNTCSQFYLTQSTHEQVRVPAVRIHAGAQSLTPVLFTGGVHARELVPPDTLLSFCNNLLWAYDNGSDVIYSDFTDTDGNPYDQYIVDNSTVKTILENFSLFVVPCVNPDGRNFVLSASDPAHKMWRKNRRPDPTCPGVDINRNFPFVWDADTYYAPSVVSTINTSKNPCAYNFRGYTQAPSPNTGAEPETQNLIDLVAQQRIQYLVDVHMSGRNVLYPWGMETDQSTNASQNFSNSSFDRNRDGLTGSAYGEYLPNNATSPRGQLLDRLAQLADSMAAEVTNSAGSDPTAIGRSTYIAKQSVLLAPTTGAFDDYTFGQQFVNTSLATTCAFTLECGFEGGNPNDPDDRDGGFAPDFDTQYPKVEREVHAALFGLFKAI
jgi:hypothetical protein